MAHPHRPRAKAEERDTGFDVWIPAGVAIIAALFLLTGAHAAEPTAGPRAIYDPGRFTPDAIEREAADRAEANPPVHDYTQPSVIVAPLAPLAPPASAQVPVTTPPALVAAPVPTSAEQTGKMLRLGVAGSIAGLLVLALAALRHTWKRQRPLAI